MKSWLCILALAVFHQDTAARSAIDDSDNSLSYEEDPDTVVLKITDGKSAPGLRSVRSPRNHQPGHRDLRIDPDVLRPLINKAIPGGVRIGGDVYVSLIGESPDLSDVRNKKKTIADNPDVKSSDEDDVKDALKNPGSVKISGNLVGSLNVLGSPDGPEVRVDGNVVGSLNVGNPANPGSVKISDDGLRLVLDQENPQPLKANDINASNLLSDPNSRDNPPKSKVSEDASESRKYPVEPKVSKDALLVESRNYPLFHPRINSDVLNSLNGGNI